MQSLSLRILHMFSIIMRTIVSSSGICIIGRHVATEVFFFTNSFFFAAINQPVTERYGLYKYTQGRIYHTARSRCFFFFFFSTVFPVFFFQQIFFLQETSFFARANTLTHSRARQSGRFDGEPGGFWDIFRFYFFF